MSQYDGYLLVCDDPLRGTLSLLYCHGMYKSIQSEEHSRRNRLPNGQDDNHSSAGRVNLPAASANIHLSRR